MTIQEKVSADLKLAMTNKDTIMMSLLRVLIGEFNRVGKVIDDSKATAIIKKMVDNNKETIVRQSEGTTAFDPENLNWEIRTLEGYLPAQLSLEQLEMFITQLIADSGASSMKEMGKVMSGLKPYTGQYDGKVASEIIKKKLG